MKNIATREKGLVLVFLLALVWGAWNYRHLFTQTGPHAQRSQAVLAHTMAGDVATGAEAPISGAVVASSQPQESSWGSDPFDRSWRHLGSPPSPEGAVIKKPALYLTAIVVRPQARYAIINGQIVREGQRVAGRQVTRIEVSRVLVDDNGVEVSLSL